MPPKLNKAQVRKLGERLCVEEPRTEDLEALAALQDDYLAALERVDYALREVLGLASGALRDGVRLTLSNRLKRDRRIIEKLRRGTELDRMQDIVGFRIVGRFTLGQQDDLTNEIATHFSGTVKDRRSKPSFGYRAVHVVGLVDGFLVEVQIRTVLQDFWAQNMESISDAWGRDIQYGGSPEAGSEETLAKRVTAVDAFKALSPVMASIEEYANELRMAELELEALEGESDPRDNERRKWLEGKRAESEAGGDQLVAELGKMIDHYNALLAQIAKG